MRDRVQNDAMTSRAKQIATRVAVMNIKQKLREIEDAVERKVAKKEDCAQ